MNLLYKYMAVTEHSIENLNNGVISFSSLHNLNDPFEGIGRFMQNELCDESCAVISDLQKSIGENLVQDCKNDLISKYRVLCLTERYDHPLMWAHYSSSHTGFCVGYKKEDIEAVSDSLQKISYVSQPYNIKDNLEELLFIKSKDWEYENELRAIYKLTQSDIKHSNQLVSCEDKISIPQIIAPNIGANPKFEILQSKKYITKKCVPQVVYLGLKIDLGSKRRILDICRKNQITVFEMIQTPNSFELSAQLCTD